MHLLDTDHVSLIDRGGTEGRNILNRLTAFSSTEIAVSVVSYEEQMRGWMARLAQFRAIDQQIVGYSQLEQMLQYYCATPLLPFDDRAAEEFQSLWTKRIRMGTMDMKIASIALAHNATLLTRNTSDFARVPDLRMEDWSI